MFQLSIPGAISAGPGQVDGTDDRLGSSGFQGLLAGDAAALAPFSAELQSLLMQLSPQLLQQIEDSLADGMSLPQAASSLLGDKGLAGFADRSGQVLDGEILVSVDLPALKTPPAGVNVQNPLPPVLQGLLGADTAGNGTFGLVAAMAPQTVTPAASLTGGNTMPMQLAAHLVDMGVPQRVGDRGWSQAVADRIVWMVQGEQQFAKLKLNPPNLGPLEVRVSVSNDQASVSFIAQHAAVREALEAALPRLREMFDQQSLDLVRADIGDPGAQQGERSAESEQQGQKDAAAPADQAAAIEEQQTASSALVSRLVDLFA